MKDTSNDSLLLRLLWAQVRRHGLLVIAGGLALALIVEGASRVVGLLQSLEPARVDGVGTITRLALDNAETFDDVLTSADYRALRGTGLAVYRFRNTSVRGTVDGARVLVPVQIIDDAFADDVLRACSMACMDVAAPPTVLYGHQEVLRVAPELSAFRGFGSLSEHQVLVTERAARLLELPDIDQWTVVGLDLGPSALDQLNARTNLRQRVVAMPRVDQGSADIVRTRERLLTIGVLSGLLLLSAVLTVWCGIDSWRYGYRRTDDVLLALGYSGLARRAVRSAPVASAFILAAGLWPAARWVYDQAAPVPTPNEVLGLICIALLALLGGLALLPLQQDLSTRFVSFRRRRRGWIIGAQILLGFASLTVSIGLGWPILREAVAAPFYQERNLWLVSVTYPNSVPTIARRVDSFVEHVEDAVSRAGGIATGSQVAWPISLHAKVFYGRVINGRRELQEHISVRPNFFDVLVPDAASHREPFIAANSAFLARHGDDVRIDGRPMQHVYDDATGLRSSGRPLLIVGERRQSEAFGQFFVWVRGDESVAGVARHVLERQGLAAVVDKAADLRLRGFAAELASGALGVVISFGFLVLGLMSLLSELIRQWHEEVAQWSAMYAMGLDRWALMIRIGRRQAPALMGAISAGTITLGIYWLGAELGLNYAHAPAFLAYLLLLGGLIVLLVEHVRRMTTEHRLTARHD